MAPFISPAGPGITVFCDKMFGHPEDILERAKLGNPARRREISPPDRYYRGHEIIPTGKESHHRLEAYAAGSIICSSQ